MKLTDQAHAAIRDVLRPGGIAIDATAGNGHDTLFLAETVGSTGVVFALDVQREALAQTATRLQTAGHEHVQLIQAGHETLMQAIPGTHHKRIDAVMFNLGYLPGGDKTRMTQANTTCIAINAALKLLKAGGMLTVLAYPGHAGGAAEAELVAKLLIEASGVELSTMVGPRPEISPRLFVARLQ